MNFFRVDEHQPRPGLPPHAYWAVRCQRARLTEAAQARAGWTGVYTTRVILRRPGGGIMVKPYQIAVFLRVRGRDAAQRVQPRSHGVRVGAGRVRSDW